MLFTFVACFSRSRLFGAFSLLPFHFCPPSLSPSRLTTKDKTHVYSILVETVRLISYFLLYKRSITLFTQQIKNAVDAGNITWQKHVLQRMLERSIYRSDIISVLISGELIEYYEDDKPFPSGLFLGHVNKKPLHVVAAINKQAEQCYVITAYQPDLKHFKPDFKTRK